MTKRALNRTLLARQLLLERADLPLAEAVERVAGLQAQVPTTPYTGLWTRLAGFRREQLDEALAAGDVVRAAMFRSTMHLVSLRDYRAFRRAIEPALMRAFQGFNSRYMKGLDPEPVVADASALFERHGTLRMGELRERLAELHPEIRPETLLYLARSRLPLVQAAGSQAYRVASGLADGGLAELKRRYVAAFGPADRRDFQTWSGLTGVADMPGDEGPLPDEDTPAPPRFLPEYDNALLSHADRGRIVHDRHRKAVFPGAGLGRATVLVDGFVAGTWKADRKGRVEIEWLGRTRARTVAEEKDRLEAFLASR